MSVSRQVFVFTLFSDVGLEPRFKHENLNSPIPRRIRDGQGEEVRREVPLLVGGVGSFFPFVRVWGPRPTGRYSVV